MIKKAALIAVSVGLVVYLLTQIDVREVFRAMYNFPLAYLLGGFVLFLAGHFLRAYRFRVLLRGDIPVGSLFSIIAIQTAAAGLMPLRSGELSLVFLLTREHEVDWSVGAALLVLAKALDFLVVVALFFVSLSAIPSVPPQVRSVMPWFDGLFVLTAFSLVILGRSRDIYARLPKFMREGRFAGGKLMTNVKNIFRAAEVIRSVRVLVLSLVISAVMWSLLYASSFAIVLGLGLKLNFFQLIFLITAMSLFANLPIHSPGGFGTMESFWTLIMVSMGVPRDIAISTGFASHLITIAYSLAFMLYGLRLIRKKEA